MDLDDFELVKLAMAGDQNAYKELMKRYKKSVYFVILKMVNNNGDDADDLTLETFAKAFNKLEKYDPNQALFNTWLFRIAINHTIDFNRKKKLKILSIDREIKGEDNSFVPSYRSTELDPEENLIQGQRKESVHNLAEKLKPKYRKLIQLRFFEQLSYKEIAEKMNIPIGTVKAQLSRAKQILRDLLGDKDSDDVDD